MFNLRQAKNVTQRRRSLEKKLGISLKNVGSFSLSEKTASTRNCENMIGVAQIPLGVAGPIKIRKQNYFLPLATTEGALVASVNRGCRAISLSGEVTVLVENIGMTRGPVFKTSSLSKSLELKNWLEEHFSDLKACGRKTSGHLNFKKMETQILGRNVYVRFCFDTQEAMGMNMATLATASMVRLIEKETGCDCLSLSANFCVDKKPAWLNLILGRGKRVWAEAQITEEVVNQVLRTTPEKIFEVWLNKCLLGSVMAGSMGFNAHFGNIIAAIFAATGQDLAHVSEGCLGTTVVELVKKDLFISIYLPDLPIGTIGGGTSLATQKESLAIMGLKNGKEGSSLQLAEMIGGAVLAGELSLLASLAEGSLVQAHQKLAGRKNA